MGDRGAQDVGAPPVKLARRSQTSNPSEASPKRFALADGVLVFAEPSKWAVGRLRAPSLVWVACSIT
jgi:hypothetical protein